jgi:hypothetical protein
VARRWIGDAVWVRTKKSLVRDEIAEVRAAASHRISALRSDRNVTIPAAERT